MTPDYVHGMSIVLIIDYSKLLQLRTTGSRVSSHYFIQRHNDEYSTTLRHKVQHKFWGVPRYGDIYQETAPEPSTINEGGY